MLDRGFIQQIWIAHRNTGEHEVYHMCDAREWCVSALYEAPRPRPGVLFYLLLTGLPKGTNTNCAIRNFFWQRSGCFEIVRI